MLLIPKAPGPHHRKSGVDLLNPQAFAGRAAGSLFTLAAGLVLVALFLIDVLTPPDFSVTALSIFPVLVVAWLCSARQVLMLTVFAVALHAGLAFHGDLSYSRGSVHILADVSMAIIGRVASVSLASVRDSREQELETLLQVARGLSGTAELQEVLEEVARAGASFVSHGVGGRSRASVFRLRGAEAQVVAENDSAGHRLAGRSFPVSALLAGIIAGGRAQVVRREEMAEPMREAFEAIEVAEIAMAPIKVGGAAIGWLSTASRGQDGFYDSELRLLEGIADLAGIAIESAERLESERRRVRTFESLHQVATAVAVAAQPSDVALLVADKALEIAGAGTAVLAWQARTGDVLRVLASRPAGTAVAFDPRRGAVGTAFTEGRAVLASDASGFEQEADRLIAGEGGTILAVPLVVRGQPLGALAVGSRADFSADAVTAVELLASQVAPLINQSRLQAGIDESESGFRELYRALACGILIHDSAGRFQDSNWAAENLLGLSRDQLAAGGVFGSGWSMRLPNGTELPQPMRPPAGVASYGRPIQGLVVRVTPPEGTPRWLRIDSHPVNERGSKRWIVTSFFEVAEPAPNSASTQLGRRR